MVKALAEARGGLYKDVGFGGIGIKGQRGQTTERSGEIAERLR